MSHPEDETSHDEPAPLTKIIRPFELGGLCFEMTSIKGGDHTVEISAGFGTAGDGGRFVVSREDDCFSVTKSPMAGLRDRTHVARTARVRAAKSHGRRLPSRGIIRVSRNG
jgi:hypothetical protein